MSDVGQFKICSFGETISREERLNGGKHRLDSALSFATVTHTMSATLPPVRRISLSEIEEARERIRGTVIRTPLVKVDLGDDFPDVRLKLENLQPTNSYKIRGAANAVAMLSDAERGGGVWTISAGNAGQAVAYAARQFGVPCTVVAIETAPQTKLDRMRALGAKLIAVPYETAWRALDDRLYPGAEGTFVHPFDDDNFIAGHGTMALEILEDVPETTTILAGVGGGGLVTGIGSGIKAVRPETTVLGVEPETAAPAEKSFQVGSAQVFESWQHSFVDGAGGHSVFPRMWERMRPVIDGAFSVSLEQTRRAMRLLAEKTRVVAEGAGALSLAGVLSRKATGGPIVCVVSGGNVDLKKFAELIDVSL